MTISSTTQRASYTGNGVTTAFSFPYPFQAQADIVVVETVIATGVQTTKTLTTDYTISGTPDDAGRYPNGGTINAVSAPASTVTWSIYNDPDPTQETDLVENDPLPAETLEAAFDKLTILVQRLNDRVNRALQQPEGDSAAIARLPAKVSRLGKLLRFNATTGDPEVVAVADAGFSDPTITAGDAGKLVGVNSAETALEVKTATQALAAIGATAVGEDLLTATDAADARTAIAAASSALTISAGGLATGGGDLSANRTITVTAASQAEAEAGASSTVAMTPQRTAQAIAALGASDVEYISTLTASNSASLAFTAFDSTKYCGYIFRLSQILPATDNVGLNVRTSTNGGSSYDAGASDYAYVSINSLQGGANGISSSAAATALNVATGNNVGNVADEAVSGVIEIFEPDLAAQCRLLWHLVHKNPSNAQATQYGGGSRLASADVDGIQISFTSGNIASGKMYCYGIRKA